VPQHRLDPWFTTSVDICSRWPKTVIAVAVAVAIAAGAYAATSLTVNTDTTEMISSELTFRQQSRELARVFPQLENNFVAIVQSDDPAIAREAAQSLAVSFRSRPDVFHSVHAPELDPFFEQNGLLYLDDAQFQELVERFRRTAPMLQGLTRDQTLRGLAEFFRESMRRAMEAGTDNGQSASFEPFLAELDRVAKSTVQGEPQPFDWQRFLAGQAGQQRNQNRYFIAVTPALDYGSLSPAEEALQVARSLAADPETSFSGRAEILITGEAAINAEELRSVSDGMVLAAIISFILVALILAVGVRSWKLVLASLGTLIIGLVWTAGFATLTVGYLNLISVAFAVLFVGLGIDFAIHYSLRYEEEVRAQRPHEEALRNTARAVGWSLAVTTGAAALAFLAFTPTAFVGMTQLGVISAFGMAIAFIASLTVLPALLTLIPRFRSGNEGRSLGLGIYELPDPLRRVATMVILVVTALSFLVLPQVTFVGDPMKLKDPDAPAVQAFEQLLRNSETSPYVIQVLAEDASEARTLSERLEQIDAVDSVVSILTFVPSGQEERIATLRQLRGALPQGVRPPTDPGPEARESAIESLQTMLQVISANAQGEIAATAAGLRASLADFEQLGDRREAAYLQYERAIFRDLPAAIEGLRQALQAQPVTEESLPADITERYVSGGYYRLEVLPAQNIGEEPAMRRFVRAVSAVTGKATGAPVEIINATDVVSRAMLQATGVAAVLILLSLLFTLRRLIDVGLVLAPVAMAAILTLASTVVFDIPFNFANVIVLPLLIGLGVAGGIHLVVRAREVVERRNGDEDRVLVATCTPRAVLLSALTTLASFGTLALSDHRGISSMGALLTISIGLTLVCTLIVLPKLIDWLLIGPAHAAAAGTAHAEPDLAPVAPRPRPGRDEPPQRPRNQRRRPDRDEPDGNDQRKKQRRRERRRAAGP